MSKYVCIHETKITVNDSGKIVSFPIKIGEEYNCMGYCDDNDMVINYKHMYIRVNRRHFQKRGENIRDNFNSLHGRIK